MPRCATLHRYMKSQKGEGGQGVLADDPNVHYLLGFERDKVETLPVKTYIRRLWLAFESSKHSSMPRIFLDPRAETFSKEIEAWVSDFVKNEDHLAIEVAKDPFIDEDTKTSRSAFLEDTARTILVTRQWGDHLWGSRKFCGSPLANEKREPGDNQPPEWPRDQELIVMNVRHWLAARLQEKLQNPRQPKNVPRVECRENPPQRRESITAVLPDTILYNSEKNFTHIATKEPVNVAEDATQSQSPKEYPPRRKSMRQPRLSRKLLDATATQPQAMPQADRKKFTHAEMPLLSSSNPQVPPPYSNNDKADTVVPQVYPNAQPLLKRKRGVIYVKRSKTVLNAGKSTKPLPATASSRVVTREPLGGVNVPQHEPSSASSLDLVRMNASQSIGNSPYKYIPPHEHTIPQDYSDPAAIQGIDDLDVDFTLLGDPSAGDPHGDSF